MEGHDWQTINIPLAAGVDQGRDDRALAAPALAIATDVQWEERGGIQLRPPFAALGLDLLGGGTVTDPRRLVRNGDEFVLFSRTGIYSWLPSQQKWAPRGTHLAIAVDEQAVFTTTGDQRDCDRAELAGVILFTWVDAAGLWVAAQDAATRSTLMSPTLANAVGTRPRFVALTTTVLLFWIDTAAGDLEVIAIDPASPATAIAGAATTVIAAANLYYDVTRVPGADTAIGGVRHTTTTSYKLFKVTGGLAVTSSTKARTCDGPIAVSCEPTGALAQVIRANGTAIQGDRITISSLADAATGQAIGTADSTPINQIAAAHRTVQDSGAYRCYAFWSALEEPGVLNFKLKSNYVDTSGSIGTQAILTVRLGVVSRAFDYDGRIYVWAGFAGEPEAAGMGEPIGIRAQLQNTYFLHRDDGLVVSRCVWQRGGGFSASTGYLPQVQLVSGLTGFAWCGTERRIIPLGAAAHTGYADRGPVDVAFSFDDARARRCARLGQTLYIAGGLVQQYDGEGPPVEVGFLYYPWSFSASTAGAGNVPNGKYSYKATWRWQNAKGETERSTTATGEQITISGGPLKVSLATAFLNSTLKQGSRRPVSIEMWRTEVDPTDDGPFYLVTGRDPATTTGDNPYINNQALFGSVGIDDNLTDDNLLLREENPENGGELENLAPPPATIIGAYGSRVYLAGVAGSRRRVWYSKQRRANEIAAFHDQLAFTLPEEGGELVALAFMDSRPVVFCESSTYLIDGDGFDNAGGGGNYVARRISADVGCRDADSVVELPTGIAFQSNKGKYLLNRGWTLTYIGGPVRDHDVEEVLAGHVDERTHQIRWLTAQRLIVCDYEIDPPQWAEWSIAGALHGAVWRGAYHYLAAAGPYALQTGFDDGLIAHGLDVETAWLKPADMQGRARVRKLRLLGEFIAFTRLRVRLSYDYKPGVVDDKLWESPLSLDAGEPIVLEIMPSLEEIESVKVRLSVVGEPVQAVLDIVGFLLGDLNHDVELTSPGSNWTAQLTATPPGALGNRVRFSIAFHESSTAGIEVRDGQRFNATTGVWSPQSMCVGVRVTGNNAGARVDIGDIEAAINATSALAQVTTNHPTPSAIINFVAMDGVNADSELDPDSDGFHDGDFAPATTEGIKLTALALEVAPLPGLHKRVAPGRRI